MCHMQYRRPGFDCEILLIANCEFFYNSQSKESQEKEYAVTRDHAPFAQTRVFNHVQLSIVEMSIRRYFKSIVNLPTPSQAQLSPNVLREVNQAVTAALEREEAGNQARPSEVKSESTTLLSHLRIALLLDDTQLKMAMQQLLRSLRPPMALERAPCGLPAWQFAIIRIAIWLV